MANALIGFSGFVGSTLCKQHSFDFLYRSTNIDDIRNKVFNIVVCAGASAQKWIANKNPKADRLKIEALIANLKTIKCEKFILISTVDVFKDPAGVNEKTPIEESELQPYGLHRRQLESFVEGYFPDHLIVRLPGLVGPGLRKNVIFDFLNENNLHAIESRGVFQFYPMTNLWYDIEVALSASLRLVHLTAEPISVSDISKKGFDKPFSQTLAGTPVGYDMRSCHAKVFGASGNYQYSARETIQAIRAYVQSEPRVIDVKSGLNL